MTKTYTKATWVDETLAGLEKYQVKNDAGAVVYSAAEIVLSTGITLAGTALSAAKMNNIENGIDTLDTLVDIHSATNKSSPVDSDETTIVDSAASWSRKKLSWGNLKNTLKTYFDTLYSSHTYLTNIGTKTHAQIDTHLASTSNPHSTTAAQVAAVPNDGWVADSNTWTYASSSTFTISGDKTSVFVKGTRIKFTQSATVKYGVVASSTYSNPNTTVTIVVNTDYTIANSAISATYYSYLDNPQGFPDWFNYAASSTGWSSLTIDINRYQIRGKTVIVTIDTSGTSNATTTAWTAPVPAANITSMVWAIPTTIQDNGTLQTTPGRARIVGNTAVINAFKDFGTGTFTASGIKQAVFTLMYEW